MCEKNGRERFLKSLLVALRGGRAVYFVRSRMLPVPVRKPASTGFFTSEYGPKTGKVFNADPQASQRLIYKVHRQTPRILHPKLLVPVG